MAKQIDGYIKLQVPAGAASPSPPVGPALGQHGLNLMDFCNSFNAKTNDMEKGLPVPVVITVYEDKSFDFIVKTTPASILIKKAAGLQKGSGTPNSLKVGKVSRAQLEEIAKIKDPDLTAADMDAAVRTLEGSARSATPHGVESGAKKGKDLSRQVGPSETVGYSGLGSRRRWGGRHRGRDARSTHGLWLCLPLWQRGGTSGLDRAGLESVQDHQQQGDPPTLPCSSHRHGGVGRPPPHL